MQATNTGYTLMKRSRGRNRRSGGNLQNAFSNPNRHYESVGPDVKIRGSAQQVLEKYLQYARDAQTSGDRILSEAYYQFAEHYQRIVAKQQEARTQQPPHQNQTHNQNQNPQNRGQGGRDEAGQPRSQPERETRTEAVMVADAGSGEEEDGTEAQADVTPVSFRRREDAEEPSDALRVIDAADEASDEEDAPAEIGGGRSEDAGTGDRGRSRRRPYRARGEREERPVVADAAAPETEGVMKTLSRGRRRPAAEEGAAAETAD
jgi:hypothetical protein